LNTSLKELLYYGFIVQTQYGGLNKPMLYAFTWLRIDKSKAETDYKVGDKPNHWKQEKRKYVKENSKKRAERKKRQLRKSEKSDTVTRVVSIKLRLVK